jgi:hypothetical protein
MRLSAFLFLLLASSCSVPNLESGECSEAREQLKRFYSARLGEEPVQESTFVTNELAAKLRERHDSGMDYFTASPTSGPLPASFRVGACSEQSYDAAAFEVRLFSKESSNVSERPIQVGMKRQDNRWLVDSVTAINRD